VHRALQTKRHLYSEKTQIPYLLSIIHLAKEARLSANQGQQVPELEISSRFNTYLRNGKQGVNLAGSHSLP
jgi:hypothetical protein